MSSICTTGSHVFEWSGTLTGTGAVPEHLRCACGRYTRPDLDVLTARLAAAEAIADTLRRRVWTLRPALELAVKRLREVYPEYEEHHEGGEIWRVIEIGERAMAATAGPDGRAAMALALRRPHGLLLGGEGHAFIPLSGSQDTAGRYTRCSVIGCPLTEADHVRR